MPPVSERQRRAMWAAAEGHSKLGIPQSVGKEFVQDETGRGLVAPEGGELTDYEAVEAMRDGEIPSPTKYGDYWLFDVRVTGTGAAYRDSLGEYAIRDPATWLSDEFINRCNGLPVIDGHPDAPGLNSEEYAERSIGNIVLPYRKGDEVWGIAKIFDEDAALLMQTVKRSTSPGVLPPKGSTPVLLESGAKVLDEPLPLNLDHLAICEAGVWDKDGPPEGVRLDAQFTRKEPVMADEDRSKELEKERDDARARADSAEGERDKEKARADAAEKALEDARKKHDESEEAAIKAAEKEKEDARRDARKMRHDKAKHDGESYMDCSRCDSEEEEERKEKEREAKERGDKSKKDAAPVEQIEATEAAIKDSKTVQAMQATITDLQSRLEASQKAPTMDDANAIATAFHRADSIYQMLGEATLRSHPGETPMAYRRRLANGLRKHTEAWKDYVFHDSLDAQAFGLIEDKIYEAALAAAKEPRHDSADGGLREVVDLTTLPGKRITRFFGNPRTAWGPFMPPVQHFIRKIDNRAGAR